MASGSFNINRTAGSTYITYRVAWHSVSNGSVANSSNVTVAVYAVKSSSSNAPTSGTANTTVTVGDSSQSEKGLSFSVSPGSETLLFAKDDFVVKHGDDGSKKVTISVNIDGYIGASGSKEVELDTIPRYATVFQSFNSKTETSITLNWSADAVCDYVFYQIQKAGEDWSEQKHYGETNGKSGTMTLSGLEADTTYNIQIHLRRKDSQLTNHFSGWTTQTTYDYPHCTSSPNFIIGNLLTLSFYNPLSRSVTVKIIGDDGSTIDVYENLTGTALKGYNAQNTIDNLYRSIPNSPSGKYKVQVTYGNSTKTRNNGNTYTVKGTETPTVNKITYQDTDDGVFAITQNRQHIVQNQSNLVISFEPATPNYSAKSISKYTFELNGVTRESTLNGGTVEFGKINSANDLTLTVTVTDSRGLTAQTEIEITMLEHKEPNATVTLERLNNYEDETYLTVDGLVSRIDGKNTMAIKYRYKLSTDSYSPFVTIPNNEKQVLSCDKSSIFVFNVVVTDAFGATFDREFILYKGVFPLFIDTQKNAVGINDFPAEGEALRVAEGVARINDGIVLMGGTIPYLVTVTESGTLTITKWSEGE